MRQPTPATPGRELGHGDPGAERVGDVLPLVLQALAVVLEIRQRLEKRQKDFYTIDEVAGMTGRSAYTVRRWVAEGRIEATRIEGTGPRGKLLVGRDQLRRLVAAGLADTLPDDVVV